MIALLAALREEASGIQRLMALRRLDTGLPGPSYAGEYRGRRVLLARTGIGQQRAEAAAEAMLARYDLDAMISIGFSGALDRHLKVGDLVLASELLAVGGRGPDESVRMIHRVDPRLLAIACEALTAGSQRVTIGPTVTTPQLIGMPAAKRGLALQTGALAADMESCWIARAASDRALPFLAVRAISDALDDRLPPFDRIVGADGAVLAKPLVAFLLREPGSRSALVRLARDARRARRTLTTAADRLMMLF